MKTRVIKINPKNPKKSDIVKCSSVLRKGGIVAFPTETVYGVGADGLNTKAVKKIFKAKNRPADNPLIFHIAEKSEINRLSKNIPKIANELIGKFWPGPLTLIFLKSKIVPKVATGGQNTVAIRMPSGKIALELIRNLGNPIVAPSANLFGKPSPTTTKHVIDDLDGKVDIIINGGRTDIGIESTVLDLSSKTPTILRPGKVSISKLKKVIKNVKYDPSLLGKKTKLISKSPGMKYRHYSPNAQFILIKGKKTESNIKINSLIKKFIKKNMRVGLINYKPKISSTLITTKNIGTTSEKIAKNIFRVFREFDEKNVDVIIMKEINEEELGFAVMNRLKKAATYTI